MRPASLTQEDLFEQLSLNLLKNSSDLRLISIRLLSKFNRDVKVFELMNDFASTPANFTTERAKQMSLERLEVMIKNEYEFEDACLTTVHRFLIGCLWVRFTPLFPFVHSAMSALLTFAPKDAQVRLMQEHSRIL